ncbi:hypothetical protein BT93_E2355 [Corymbia citriodora subsp. variegata]|nr:hypothetical protein BT93_E2355 [Corymbia citriodora subsp. variegata]
MSQPQDSQIMQFPNFARNAPLETPTPGGVYFFEIDFSANLETWKCQSPTCLTRLTNSLCCQWSLEVFLFDGNPLMTSV